MEYADAVFLTVDHRTAVDRYTEEFGEGPDIRDLSWLGKLCGIPGISMYDDPMDVGVIMENRWDSGVRGIRFYPILEDADGGIHYLDRLVDTDPFTIDTELTENTRIGYRRIGDLCIPA